MNGLNVRRNRCRLFVIFVLCFCSVEIEHLPRPECLDGWKQTARVCGETAMDITVLHGATCQWVNVWSSKCQRTGSGV